MFEYVSQPWNEKPRWTHITWKCVDGCEEPRLGQQGSHSCRVTGYRADILPGTNSVQDLG